MFRYTRYFILLGLAIFIQDSVYAKKDLVKRRQDRLALVDAPWSEPKVTINVHHRIPIYDTLGYLAANYDESAKFNQLLKQVRPIADKVKKLSGGSLKGRSFPESLDKELRADQQSMFTAIEDIYGNAVLAELKDYLAKKQEATSSGLLGLIE